jgi:hypothetical protein
MKFILLIAIGLLHATYGWASIEFSSKISETSSLAYESSSIVLSPDGQNPFNQPVQLQSLSYIAPSNNSEGFEGGIPQAAVPEPAVTSAVIAILCGAFVIGRKRASIFRFLRVR